MYSEFWRVCTREVQGHGLLSSPRDLTTLDHEIDFALSFVRLQVFGSILCTWTCVSPRGLWISSGTVVAASAKQNGSMNVDNVNTRDNFVVLLDHGVIVPHQAHKNIVHLVPKELVEKLAKFHLPAHGTALHVPAQIKQIMQITRFKDILRVGTTVIA